MTTYDVFMHYYNDDIGKAVTNQTTCKWYACLTTPQEYDSSLSSAAPYLTTDMMDPSKLEKEQETLETMYISKEDSTTPSENTSNYEKYVVSNAVIKNPKYDMIFVWDGLGFYNSTHTGETDNQLYFDKMKRITLKPWFFHSKYNSLKAAITKAQQLIDLFGKDHIMIGKEVALDQYIDIV